MSQEYKIEQNPDGDDPYGPIRIKRGHATIATLSLDDAPVQDFNAGQRERAECIVEFLNEHLWVDEL